MPGPGNLRGFLLSFNKNSSDNSCNGTLLNVDLFCSEGSQMENRTRMPENEVSRN